MTESASNARTSTYDRLVYQVERFDPRHTTAFVFQDIAMYLLEVNLSYRSHKSAIIAK